MRSQSVDMRAAVTFGRRFGQSVRRADYRWLVGLCVATAIAFGLPSALSRWIAARSQPVHPTTPVVRGASWSLPLSLRPAASSVLGGARRRFRISWADGSLRASGGGLSSSFDTDGTRLRVGAGVLVLTLEREGHGGRFSPLPRVSPTAVGNLAVYRYRSLTEWYRNGPLGVEQGFSVRRRGGAGGPLLLVMRLGGSLVAHQAGSGLLFTGPGGVSVLRYDGLAAQDSSGRRLPASLVLRGDAVELRVDDRGARYPVRIDPFFQQGSKLTASDEAGNGQFGASVALSTDGSTALIAGPEDNGPGAVWVFTRSGSTWAQQGAKLSVSGQIGFGSSVGLSSDGSTALIGVAGENKAYVFTRSGSTWTQQGGAITPSDAAGGSSFGSGVALSSDGNTALIGGDSDNPQAGSPGAAWVFTRSGSTWSQQGPKLIGTGDAGAAFGNSVALSSDGNTALIGGETDNTYVGAAWVFTRSGSTWSQQGSKLTGTGEIGAGDFGSSVALSSDGNTALIGGSGLLGTDAVGPPNSGREAWVFTRSSGAWSQQGSALTATDATDFEQFGASVALSSDGNTAVIGGPSNDVGASGKAWTFTRTASTWSQLGPTLSTSDGSGTIHFGAGVALSGAGTVALIGGPGDSGGVGAGWSFLRLPAISSVSPSVGPPAGGTVVTITGADFSGATAVNFGSTPAASFMVNSSTRITATSPAGSLGPVDVRVVDPQGTSPTSNSDTFAFATAPGAPTGVSAQGGARQATVSFTAPAANGSPITGYTVTASPGGMTAQGTGSPITVTGLSDWTSYTFTVTATNAAGVGPPSAASSAVMTLASSQTTVGIDQDPSFYGTPLTFTATVVSVQPGAGTPSGTANFVVTGEDPVPGALGANGKASYSPPFYLNVGDTVTADYTGDAKHDVSTTTVTPTILPAVTAVTLSSSANPAPPGSDVTITATVANSSTSITPFGSVHFIVAGQVVDVPLDENGQAAVDLTGFDPGAYSVEASYHDDTGPLPDFTDSQVTISQRFLGPLPTNAAPPTVTGNAVDGQVLSVTHGSWTNSPTAESETWEDCDASGANCSPIAGATSTTYTLTAADVSHTVRVFETASNANGTSAPASSAATGIVEVAPGTPGTTTVAGAAVKGTAASVPISCGGAPGAVCNVAVTLTVTESIKGGKVIAVSASNKPKKTQRKRVVIGATSITLSAGQSQIVTVSLNGTGRRLLAQHQTLKVTLAVSQNAAPVASSAITFKSKRKQKKPGRH